MIFLYCSAGVRNWQQLHGTTVVNVCFNITTTGLSMFETWLQLSVWYVTLDISGYHLLHGGSTGLIVVRVYFVIREPLDSWKANLIPDTFFARKHTHTQRYALCAWRTSNTSNLISHREPHWARRRLVFILRNVQSNQSHLEFKIGKTQFSC